MTCADRNIQPLLYSIADALEINLIPTEDGFTGSRKAVMELFEGYSPCVISGINNSLVDKNAGIAAAELHVFGNLGLVIIAEDHLARLSLFVIDRSKRHLRPPFRKGWSRKGLYAWLEVCTKAVYSRYMYDHTWQKLPEGVRRLRQYNTDRSAKIISKDRACNDMWGR